jgi:hypothetical protein
MHQGANRGRHEGGAGDSARAIGAADAKPISFGTAV